MIEARPDVLDAVADVAAQLRELRDRADLERLVSARCGKYRAGYRTAAVLEFHEAAMLRVDVEQEAIVDFEFVHARRARGTKTQHQITAVAVPVDGVVGDRQRTTRAGGV